jgi:acyl-CoA thioesterase-2
MGGSVAAIVTRALGAEAALPRPASFFCHYLRGARFGDIEVEVRPVRQGRSAESLRAVATQDGREVMDATLCVVADNDGLEHEVTAMPDVPPPDELESVAEFVERTGSDPRPFWENFDARPCTPWTEEPLTEPRDPVWRQWHRFVPTDTFDDPWTDAARVVLLCDLPLWPAAMQHHGWKYPDRNADYIAPTLDLYVAFHRAVPTDPWLLVDGAAPIAAEGLLGWNVRLWSVGGQLVASGGGQGLFRRVQPAG